jgi:peptidoglycan hydrolase CwlO-like protein
LKKGLSEDPEYKRKSTESESFESQLKALINHQKELLNQLDTLQRGGDDKDGLELTTTDSKLRLMQEKLKNVNNKIRDFKKQKEDKMGSFDNIKSRVKLKVLTETDVM